MKITHKILNTIGSASTKKLVAATLTVLFVSQVPALGVWVAHHDFKRVDEFPDDEGDYNSVRIRQISVHFTKAKPNEDKLEPAQGKLDFEQMNTKEAKDNIPHLFVLGDFDGVELDFNAVSKHSQSDVIESVLSEFNYQNTVRVYFKDNPEIGLQDRWEKFYQEKLNAHDRFQERQQERIQRRQERIDDFAESQGAYNADLMETMGYFSDDD